MNANSGQFSEGCFIISFLKEILSHKNILNKKQKKNRKKFNETNKKYRYIYATFCLHN